MKKLVLISLLLFSTMTFAQRFKEVVLWQVETEAEGMVFGISSSKSSAKATMRDFQKRNAGSKYDISAFDPIYKYTTFPVKTRKESPVRKFKALAGKSYKVLSAEDIESIDIVKTDGLQAGVHYYMDLRAADEDFVTSRLKDLVTNFDQFRIEKPERYLVYSK